LQAESLLKLSYTFTNSALLRTALTHRSAGLPNNERLEFLGDAILSYIIGEELYQRFPHAKEGELTRMRAHLVKGETLAVLARELNLGEVLRLGGGELKSGGWRRTSILADALEALIGAIYLDSGMENCKGMVLQIYAAHLAAISPKKDGKDPKTRLQEYLQARQQPLPEYQVTEIKGDPHAQWFEVSCCLPNLSQAFIGAGKNRRYAEQAAAQQALDLLEQGKL
jgi:ribonuclease III